MREEVVGRGDGDPFAGFGYPVLAGSDGRSDGKVADRTEQVLHEIEGVSPENLDQSGAASVVVGVGSPGGNSRAFPLLREL